jgi:tol-pal system protein YbgF
VSRLIAVVAVAVVAGAGCASQLSMVKADNHRLREQLTVLRGDKRRAERKVRELENELSLRDDRADTVAIGKKRTGAPILPVEVMTPDPNVITDLEPGQRVVGIAEDGTAIIYEGDASGGKVATFDGSDGFDEEFQHEPSPPPRPRARPQPRRDATADRIQSQTRVPARPANERAGAEAAELYRAAVDLLRAGHHDDAIAQLRDFVKLHPGHDYADNAQYWLGEAFYDRKDYAKALAEFRVAVDKYPRGNKVPDALLKVGYCYLALGQAEKGRFALEQVLTIYPKTPPALLAGKRLETIPR